MTEPAIDDRPSLDDAFEQAKRHYPDPFWWVNAGGTQEIQFRLIDAYLENACHPEHLRGNLVMQENRTARYALDDIVVSWPRNHWGFTVADDSLKK